MTVPQFDHIPGLFAQRFERKSLSENISPGERLAVTLRFLASGDLMRSISFLFRLGASKVSQIIQETCWVLWEVLGALVFPPLTEDLWKEVAEDFDRMWNFPNSVGAIDSKHCNFHAFPNSGSMYYNYKGDHSLILLAVSDANYSFIAVDVGSSGCQSDGGVFQNSKCGQKFVEGSLNIPPPKALPGTLTPVPHVIVGDEAFPLRNQIMRPFPGEYLPDDKIIYNYRLSCARRVVENAFGVLSARWRILRKTVIASHRTANGIIRASVCLQNFLVKREQEVRPSSRVYIPPRFVDGYDPDGDLIPGQWRLEEPEVGFLQPLHGVRIGSRTYTAAANEVREKFVDYFIDKGQVSWQWKHLPRT